MSSSKSQMWGGDEYTNEKVRIHNEEELFQLGTVNTDAMYSFPAYYHPMNWDSKEAFAMRRY